MAGEAGGDMALLQESLTSAQAQIKSLCVLEYPFSTPSPHTEGYSRVLTPPWCWCRSDELAKEAKAKVELEVRTCARRVTVVRMS